MPDEKEKQKDPIDAALDQEIMKNNLHRIMLDNLDIVGQFLQLRTDVFMQVCWDQGILNKKQIEQLLVLLLRAKIIHVKPMPK